nr:hypothetical protein L203_00520 [Cryptococcus depauperatus CBS 7841]
MSVDFIQRQESSPVSCSPPHITSGSLPRSGILLNGPNSLPSAGDFAYPYPSLAPANNGSLPPSQPVHILSPHSQHHSGLCSHDLAQSPLPSPSLTNSGGEKPKIRFAPLPDPRRQRSLSTGRNIAWTSRLDANGSETRQISLVGVEKEEEAVDDDTDDEDDGERDKGSSRRWSRTMGSSWKGTKKLLSGKNLIKDKNKDGPTNSGVSLARSSSTGSLMGSSPFRWTLETERKHNMQGSPPASVSSLLSFHRPETLHPSPVKQSIDHQRNSSQSPASGSALGASPGTVRMLNGRVYGSRRASQIAKQEEDYLAKLEPVFVEWGSAGVGANLDSSLSTSRKGDFLGDEDDGGGMAWVRKRRMERQKREQEKRETERLAIPQSPGDEGLSSSQGSESSLGTREVDGKLQITGSVTLHTPAIYPEDLPSHSPTIIRVSAPSSPAISPSTQKCVNQHDQLGSPIQLGNLVEGEGKKSTSFAGNENNIEKKAMALSSENMEKHNGQHFHRHVIQGTFGDQNPSLQEEDESSSEEEDEEDDDDDEDEDEEELGTIRTTSSAAGIEVVSRHRS